MITERKTYLFFIFNEVGAPLYVDDGGNVQAGDPTTLKRPDGKLADLDQAPEGWPTILVKYARNMELFGSFRTMSVPLEFPGDGADILFDAMWNGGGVEAVRHLGIMLLDKLNLPYEYQSWHICELDFKKYVQKQDKIAIQALEGGLHKYFQANRGTKYPIDLDVPTSIHLIRDGIVLTERANYEVVGGIELPFDVYSDKMWLPLNFMNKEGASSGMAWFTQTLRENTESPEYPILTPNWISKTGPRLNPNPAQVEITGKIVYEVLNDGDGSTAFRMRFQTSLQDFGNQDDYNLGAGHSLVAGEINTTNVNIVVPMPPGTALYLMGIYFGAGPNDNANIKFISSKLVFKFTNRMETTYSKEMYPIDLLKAIVNKMTEGKYTAESAWLTAKKDLSITCGDSIRFNGIQAEHKVEMSLNDFKAAMTTSSGEAVGMAIRENKLIVEPLAEFFKSDIILELGELGDFPEVSVLEDLIYNEIRAGYGKEEYENVNGKLEFNQGQDWKTPILKVQNKLDLESPCKGDPIGTEIYRIESTGLDTTDKSSDKKPFISKIETTSQTVIQEVDFVAGGNYMTNPGNYPFNPGIIVRIVGGLNDGKLLQVVATGTNIVQFDISTPVVDELGIATTVQFVTGGLFKFSRPAYSSIVGIPAEMHSSIYNTEITPKQAVLNNGQLISAACDQLDTKLVSFIKADMNDALETTLAGVTLKQKEAIQIAGLRPKLWKPYAIKIRAKASVDALALIELNPYGLIGFKIDDFQFYVYLMDGGAEPDTLAVQEWILLPTGTTNMAKLKIRE
jgi:hypothetical protein